MHRLQLLKKHVISYTYLIIKYKFVIGLFIFLKGLFINGLMSYIILDKKMRF